jgi:hypothetical protein
MLSWVVRGLIWDNCTIASGGCTDVEQGAGKLAAALLNISDLLRTEERRLSPAQGSWLTGCVGAPFPPETERIKYKLLSNLVRNYLF